MLLSLFNLCTTIRRMCYSGNNDKTNIMKSVALFVFKWARLKYLARNYIRHLI